MKAFILLLLIFISPKLTHAQNTVGTITASAEMSEGYTLFSPLTSNHTYLINNCGEIVKQWSSQHFPGASVYLLENGNLLRTGRISNPNINFGGVGGKIELFNWDGALIWEYTHSGETFTQHHDIYPLPNGNILMLSAEVMTIFEAIQAGRNPSLLEDGGVYNEQILELEPVGSNQANIVWEWNFKDHLVQDFDDTKSNFGSVEDNPQLVDFNYINSPTASANWLHINSIQYSESLNQIILSSRILSEIYIIDHSTTTAEAASHTGGLYGKGGDFLYRWGNPEAYDYGTSEDRKLFGQHYPHRIADGLADEGNILIFNNRTTFNFSSVDIIEPPETAPGVYEFDVNSGYGPSDPEWQYIAPQPSDFYSAILSSAQRLPNGSTLICDGDSGYFFEIDSNENIVWEYINPDSSTGILSQGDVPTQNFVFRALKFPSDYPAFLGRDLTPNGTIETNGDTSDCNNLLNLSEAHLADIFLYPNPSNSNVQINSSEHIDKIEVYSILGNKITEVLHSRNVDVSSFANGVYLLKIYSNGHSVSKRIIKN